MRLVVEIEPVLLKGGLSDKQYYGFRIVGGPVLQQGSYTGIDPIYSCPNAAYPGNDAMRHFFNNQGGLDE
jgi:hypothetical protein